MRKLLTEIAGVALVVAGIYLISLPAALIVAGLAVVTAIEIRG